MPIYEYVPKDRDCLMCDGKVCVIQGIHESALEFCPDCGLEVTRIISQASFSISKEVNHDKAGNRGFSTWKKSGTGVWEKIAGDGADYLVGDSTPAPVKTKVHDLDSNE